MDLESQISAGIMEAMKARDDVRRDTLRNIKKVILEAKTAGPGKQSLSDEEVLKIIGKLCKQGQDTAAIYEAQGRRDLYDYEMAQVKVLQEFLPVQMSPAELADAVGKIIDELGAVSMQDMGKVMALATKRLAGQAEGKDISAQVKELLAK